MDTLIKKCICGNKTHFNKMSINNIDVLECNICKTKHQYLSNFSSKNLLDFYTNEYHDLFQKTKGIISYSERYEHDCKIANLRLKEYAEYISPPLKGLDIGSSNSAFVHEANKLEFNVKGLEPGFEIGDSKLTIRKTIEAYKCSSNTYDFITMHDSIEHLVDVSNSIKKVYRILKKSGYVFIDLPDFYSPAGKHHWKKIEHLWFFSKDDLKVFLEKIGFEIIKITNPIPGKLVFYCKK